MHDSVVKIFIGYDPVESVAWHTMAHSILARSSRPVAIVPVNIANLQGVFTRQRDPKQSNEFSFTRFLVPHLCDYSGHALFFDCDMLLRTDVCQIFDVLNEQPDKAVYVVKHDYDPKCEIKYLNTVQHKYPRKNWSSVVLWNCGHEKNRAVTPDFVNTATPMELHRFLWLDDGDIGELNVRWNWLVGEYDEPPADVKNVHWTIGGPYFTEYSDADFSDEWRAENKKMAFCLQRDQVEAAKK
ncbi:MAG: glycosyltransferase [Chloroflexota bacterium]|jgi:lipopolysaccharide biosynthesis glycosyltransferase